MKSLTTNEKLTLVVAVAALLVAAVTFYAQFIHTSNDLIIVVDDPRITPNEVTVSTTFINRGTERNAITSARLIYSNDPEFKSHTTGPPLARKFDIGPGEVRHIQMIADWGWHEFTDFISDINEVAGNEYDRVYVVE